MTEDHTPSYHICDDALVEKSCPDTATSPPGIGRFFARSDRNFTSPMHKIRGMVMRVISAIWTAQRRRNALLHLNDRQLRDIGLERQKDHYIFQNDLRVDLADHDRNTPWRP